MKKLKSTVLSHVVVKLDINQKHLSLVRKKDILRTHRKTSLALEAASDRSLMDKVDLRAQNKVTKSTYCER